MAPHLDFRRFVLSWSLFSVHSTRLGGESPERQKTSPNGTQTCGLGVFIFAKFRQVFYVFWRTGSTQKARHKEPKERAGTPRPHRSSRRRRGPEAPSKPQATWRATRAPGVAMRPRARKSAASRAHTAASINEVPRDNLFCASLWAARQPVFDCIKIPRIIHFGNDASLINKVRMLRGSIAQHVHLTGIKY